MSDPRPSSSLLDSAVSRLGALAVFLAVVVLLGFIHRDDLFPPPATAIDPNDPVALCVAERAPAIEAMRADGTIDERQAELFMSRTKALCQAQAGQSPSGQPGAPALPAQ